jgi:hypothetical protein
MPLIVEDSTGLPDAESYASVDEADAYTLARHLLAWQSEAIDDARKEAALRVATEYIETNYGPRFLAERFVSDQALSFPDEGGFVPSAVIRATIELAVIALDGPLWTIEDLSRVIVQESKGVGPLQKSVTYKNPEALQKLYRQVDMMLRPLLRFQGLRAVRV